MNKLEKHYRNSQTQDYINKLKAKVGGSEQRVNPSGSCYIATIIYGDYDSKEVYILREYRDSILSKNVFGLVFIKLYYGTSSLIKPVVKNSKIIQQTIKCFLDWFINKSCATVTSKL